MLTDVRRRDASARRLPGSSADGLLRRRGASLQRLLHRDGASVHVAVIQPAPQRVIFGSRADSETDAMWGIRRLRFATGVDDDLRAFHEAFRDDPVIGRAVRFAPGLRVRRVPLPWEALANAVTEQLIEFERAVTIQRRMIAALGTRCATTGLRDAPAPARIAATAPARLTALDLAPARAHAAPRRRRGCVRPRRPARRRPAARLAAAAGDPRHRAVDARGARALRPGRS